MNTGLMAWVLLFASAAAHATSIESVSLLRDADGSPGATVEEFAPTDLKQHFKLDLDELKLGQHEFVVEFWADQTAAGNNLKITEFTADALVANTIDASVSLPNPWPMGWYRLEVRMDGESIGTHRYRVGVPWAEQTITSWALYPDDGKGNPAQAPVEAFSADDQMQHFEMATDGYLKRSAAIKIVFTALDTSAGQNLPVQTVEFVVPNDEAVFGTITSQLSLPRAWPVGDYEIAVFDGARLLGKHHYQVVAAE